MNDEFQILSPAIGRRRPASAGQAARDRLESGLTRIRSEVAAYAASVDSHWSNDQLVFSVRALGRTFTGKIDVLDDAVRLEVDLPWLLSLAAKTIVAHIRHTGTSLLRT